jgi:CSLREA domain-containing protein
MTIYEAPPVAVCVHRPVASERSSSAHKSHILPNSNSTSHNLLIRRIIVTLLFSCTLSSLFVISSAGVFKGRNCQHFGRLKMEGDNLMAAKSAVVEMRALLRMRVALTAAMLAVVALALTTATANATTYTVNTLSDPTGPSGTCSLRDAITAANTKTATNGCTAGTGNDTIRFSVTGTILLASTLPQVTDCRLTITGPPSPGITINGGNNPSQNVQGVQVMQVASRTTLDLRNLTIANGSNMKGGGILNEGTLRITSSTFSGNELTPFVTNDVGGAGIYNDRRLTVTSSTFSGNNAAVENGAGGGIYNHGNLRVTKSTFSKNLADGGGGISNDGRLRITSSTFSGNFTHGDGSGINNAGVLTITNSTFSGNDGNFVGGGIFNTRMLTVINSTFSGNIASIGGGGGIYNSGTLKVINSTFSDNQGNTVGGGIDNEGTLSVLTNSTFFANIASEGGGVYNDTGTLTVTNNTFYNNDVFNNCFSCSGGGIYNSNPGLASLKNTILAGSTGGDCSGTITDAGYNISDDHTCGFAKTGSANNGDGVNPLLSAAGLANNGGPTQTIALDSESPAIDAIPLADCTDQASPPKRIITDQRGALRPDAGEVQCDIGAYEFQDFAGQPFCGSKSIFALVRRFGSLEAAASALGFPSVKALLKAIQISCGG